MGHGWLQKKVVRWRLQLEVAEFDEDGLLIGSEEFLEFSLGGGKIGLGFFEGFSGGGFSRRCGGSDGSDRRFDLDQAAGGTWSRAGRSGRSAAGSGSWGIGGVIGGWDGRAAG